MLFESPVPGGAPQVHLGGDITGGAWCRRKVVWKPWVFHSFSPTHGRCEIPPFFWLVGGFNLSEKYQSNWKSSPSRGENKKYLKPPPSFLFPSPPKKLSCKGANQPEAKELLHPSNTEEPSAFFHPFRVRWFNESSCFAPRKKVLKRKYAGKSLKQKKSSYPKNPQKFRLAVYQ